MKKKGRGYDDFDYDIDDSQVSMMISMTSFPIPMLRDDDEDHHEKEGAEIIALQDWK